MDSLNTWLANTKTNVMRKMINYTDGEYYLLKFKLTLDKDE